MFHKYETHRIEWARAVIAGFLLAALVCVSDKAEAAVGGTLNRPVIVSAEIPSELTLDMRIVDQLTASQVPSMDFGELVRVGEEFRAKTYFKVFIKVNSVGAACELTQTGTPLARLSGTETIPSGAYMMKPSYDESENASLPMPALARLAPRGKVAENRSLYTDPSGSSRTVTIVYTLSGDPITSATEVISLSQKSGSYNGTITFTLTTV